jgi:hypothetical protein
MAYTHGHNYTYSDPSNEEITFFPVAWDLRGVFYELRNYYQYYHGYTEEHAESSAETFISGILSEAMSYGVNTLIIRIEPKTEAELLLTTPTNTIARAEQARNLGLNVILGGIKSGGETQAEEDHNWRVCNYWELYWNDYIAQNSPPPGDFCGVYAHDEPDNHNYEYYDEVASIALRLAGIGGVPGSTCLGLPLGAALAKVGDLHLTEEMARTDTIFYADPDNPDENWKSTPFVFGHPLDYISLNYYPALISGCLHTQVTYPEDGLVNNDPVVLRGAADLVPSEGAFRAAYCDRDEYYALTGTGRLLVFNIEGTDNLGPPSFQLHSITNTGITPSGLNYRVASSDNRSADIAPRSVFDSNLNGAVVFWRKNESIDCARAVYWHSSGVVSESFPAFTGKTSKVFCVGELDYRSGWSTNQNCSGVIGSDEMRILWVSASDPTSPWQARIFGRDSSGELYTCNCSNNSVNWLTLPSNFHPDDAIWGYFWRENSSSQHYSSGFILYTNDGDYVVIRTDPYGSEAWECSQVYSDLWGEGNVVGPVTVTRDINNYPFTRMFRTHDRFIAMVSPVNTFQNTTQMAWSSTSWQEELPDVDLIPVVSMPRVEYLSSLSVANYGMGHKIKLYVNYTDSQGHVETRYTETENYDGIPFPFQGTYIEFGKTAVCKITISEVRSRHTRFSESDVLTDRNPGIYMWAGQTVTTTPEVMFENMYSRPTSFLPQSQELGALDIMLEYGVNQPATAECLFLTVQCHGRGSFFNGIFFPGDEVMGYDELMYTMGAALVHGIRGFNLYSLEHSLAGGPANPLSQYRFPPELLYWGASVDGPNDIDMVTRTHEAIQAFTCVDEGGNTTFNLLDVLVNPDYEAMDQDEAFNAYMVGLTVAIPFTDEPYNNFLALREPDGDILVLVSTDGYGWTSIDRIVFPDTPEIDYLGYGDPELLLGDWIDVSGCYGLKYDPQGYYLNPEGLSNMGFALIRIPAPGNDYQGINTSAIIEQPRSLTVSRNTGSSVLVEAQGAEVQIFDLTGRVVERIAQGETIEFSSCLHPAGVYFAVLSEEDTPLFIEKLVLLDGGR